MIEERRFETYLVDLGDTGKVNANDLEQPKEGLVEGLLWQF